MTFHRIVFWSASAAYAATVISVGVSISRGSAADLAMFGAPAGLLLFATYLTDRRLPLPARLASACVGIALESLRVYWLRTLGAQVSAANMSIYFGHSIQAADMVFGFPFGFGLALGAVATAGLWGRVAIRGRVRDAESAYFVASLMLVQIFLLYSMALVGLASANPRTFDVQLFTFERALGIDIPATLGQAFDRWPLMQQLAALAYGTLSAAGLGSYFLQQRQRPRPPVNVLKACGLAAFAAVIYVVVPACGPGQVFGARFPHDVPMDFEAYMRHLDPALWRNAIPSLHATWALLIWFQMFFHHPSRVVQVFATLFLAFVLLATQGSGAHYFIDIVVSVPLALSAQALACDVLPLRTKARWQAVLLGSGLLTVWLLTLCLTPQSFGFYSSWGAVIVTVVLCGLSLRRLTLAAILLDGATTSGVK